METGLVPGQVPHLRAFKSHHSGMETELPDLGWAFPINFKSHHSGMETEAALRGQQAVISALNRTIVGWKRVGG